MADVIFTPVFTGTDYLHHVCSECKHEITMEQSCWGGVYFGPTSSIKFCPHCGNPVVRFSNEPIFVNDIDFEPLRPFWSLKMEFERKCRWMYFYHISDERREKIDELLPFANENSGWVLAAAKAVSIGKQYRTDGHQIKRLVREFGDEREEG